MEPDVEPQAGAPSRDPKRQSTSKRLSRSGTTTPSELGGSRSSLKRQSTSKRLSRSDSQPASPTDLSSSRGSLKRTSTMKRLSSTSTMESIGTFDRQLDALVTRYSSFFSRDPKANDPARLNYGAIVTRSLFSEVQNPKLLEYRAVHSPTRMGLPSDGSEGSDGENISEMPSELPSGRASVAGSADGRAVSPPADASQSNEKLASRKSLQRGSTQQDVSKTDDKPREESPQSDGSQKLVVRKSLQPPSTDDDSPKERSSSKRRSTMQRKSTLTKLGSKEEDSNTRRSTMRKSTLESNASRRSTKSRRSTFRRSNASWDLGSLNVEEEDDGIIKDPTPRGPQGWRLGQRTSDRYFETFERTLDGEFPRDPPRPNDRKRRSLRDLLLLAQRYIGPEINGNGAALIMHRLVTFAESQEERKELRDSPVWRHLSQVTICSCEGRAAQISRAPWIESLAMVKMRDSHLFKKVSLQRAEREALEAMQADAEPDDVAEARKEEEERRRLLWTPEDADFNWESFYSSVLGAILPRRLVRADGASPVPHALIAGLEAVTAILAGHDEEDEEIGTLLAAIAKRTLDDLPLFLPAELARVVVACRTLPTSQAGLVSEMLASLAHELADVRGGDHVDVSTFSEILNGLKGAYRPGLGLPDSWVNLFRCAATATVRDVDHTDPSYIASVASTFEQCLGGTAPAPWLANLLHVFARDAVCRSALFSTPQLCSVLHSCGILGAKDHEVLITIAGRLNEVELSCGEIAHALCALSSEGLWHEGLSQALRGRLADPLTVSADELAVSLYVFAVCAPGPKLIGCPPATWLREVALQAMSSLDAMCTRSLAILASALTSHRLINVAFADEFEAAELLGQLAPRCVDKIVELRFSDLSELWFALGCVPAAADLPEAKAMCEAMVEEMLRRHMAGRGTTSLARAAWAARRLEFIKPALMSALTHEASTVGIGLFGPSDLYMLLWGLAGWTLPKKKDMTVSQSSFNRSSASFKSLGSSGGFTNASSPKSTKSKSSGKSPKSGAKSKGLKKDKPKPEENPIVALTPLFREAEPHVIRGAICMTPPEVAGTFVAYSEVAPQRFSTYRSLVETLRPSLRRAAAEGLETEHLVSVISAQARFFKKGASLELRHFIPALFGALCLRPLDIPACEEAVTAMRGIGLEGEATAFQEHQTRITSKPSHS